MVPVNVRQTGTDGKAVSVILANLATHQASPRARLATIAASTRAGKEHIKSVPQEAMSAYSTLAMTTHVAKQLVPGAASALRPMFNLVISNVPGPKQPMYAGGARVENFFPMSLLFKNEALNITPMPSNSTSGSPPAATRYRTSRMSPTTRWRHWKNWNRLSTAGRTVRARRFGQRARTGSACATRRLSTWSRILPTTSTAVGTRIGNKMKRNNGSIICKNSSIAVIECARNMKFEQHMTSGSATGRYASAFATSGLDVEFDIVERDVCTT
ncbi:WS/DGAT domain-containing protein [Nocardia sp. NPDC052278]|uniref:WS/DGAT domain-containing protein n=1 Tax=unclassified Nocardia TaxID=2637762 RepID=UPI003694E331